MKQEVGWLILSYTLAAVLILFIVLWAVGIDKTENIKPTTVCLGNFGVTPSLDANALTVCGTSKKDLCVYSKGSLAACESECNLMPEICRAFVFNQGASIMKIVDPFGVKFPSSASNLFFRNS